MQQPERPPDVDEGRQEEHAQRDPDPWSVELAPERAGIAARHRPCHLRARPLLEHRPAAVVHLHLDHLVAVDGRSSPASGRCPSCRRSASSGPSRRASAPCPLVRRCARPRARCARRSAAARLRVGRAGVDGGRRRGQPRAYEQARRALAATSARDSSMRKLHILFPMKFSGVARRSRSPGRAPRHPGDADQQLEHRRREQERRDADGEEARRLEAGVTAACPEGPVAVPPEVVRDGDDEGGGGGDEVMQVEHLDADGEHAQVHHVAGGADGAELDQLQPVVRAAQPGAHAQVHGMWAVGDGCPRLVGHAAERYTEVLQHQWRHVRRATTARAPAGRARTGAARPRSRPGAGSRGCRRPRGPLRPSRRTRSRAPRRRARRRRAGSASADHSRPSASG